MFFLPKAIRDRNYLPIEAVEATSVSCFRKKLDAVIWTFTINVFLCLSRDHCYFTILLLFRWPPLQKIVLFDGVQVKLWIHAAIFPPAQCITITVTAILTYSSNRGLTYSSNRGLAGFTIYACLCNVYWRKAKYFCFVFNI